MANEDLHTKACQANALISSIQNSRDYEGMSDHDFRLTAQANLFLETADSYLDWTVSIEDLICLRECNASRYNYLWHLARRNLDEFGSNTEWENKFMDEVRRTLSGDVPDHQYSYQSFFKWLYDYIATEQHNEELDDTDHIDDTYLSGTGELVDDDSYIDYLNRN